MLSSGKRFELIDVFEIMKQLLGALDYSHKQGVVHRDIKPANLMISQRGQVKIADFGIALANRDFDSKLTGTGEFVGTPGYLSPEICLGKPVDQRSDIFALGIVLFEMLTGRTPFSDESPLKLMLDVVQSEIPDVRELNTEVDPQVAQILSKMVTKDPADRYQSTHELIDDLEKHPLVTQGGALKLKPAAPSGPAATLFAMATPVTPGSVMRAPTPPPSVTSPAAPAIAATAPGSTRPGVTQPSAPPAKKSKAPLMIAAVVLLALIGTAWGLRGKLFGSAPSATAETSTATINATPTNPSTAPATSTNGSAAIAANPAGNTQSAASVPPTPPDTAATVDNAGPMPPQPTAPAPAENAVTTSSPPKPAPMPAAPQPTTTNIDDASLVASNAPAETLRERIADRREAAASAPAHAGPLRVAVEIAGDPAVTLPAQQLLEDKLSGAGMNVVENARQADVVIRVRAEVIGSQELQFYGQSATVTTAYLGVRPYGRGGRPLGVGFREKIDYTPLNAEAKVQQMLENKVDRLVNNVNSKE